MAKSKSELADSLAMELADSLNKKFKNTGYQTAFFLDGDTKERASKGRCQARGVWGHAPQKILRNLTLFWRLFVRVEPFKFLSFNKV